ncbi:MAG: cupin domain-containing protein [Lautropia sp.]
MNDVTIERGHRPANAQGDWQTRARYFNSGNAFAMTLSPVPSVQFTAERDKAFDASTPTGLIDMDLSAELQTPFPATTPFVLSRYMRIRAGESLALNLRASAQTLCVLQGTGSSTANGEQTRWQGGDVLLLPGGIDIAHRATTDSVVWLVTDEPALSYLGLSVDPDARCPVEPVHYLAADLERELEIVYEHPDRDRFAGFAVVLSHANLEHTRNIHPTMTLALNSLPGKSVQRPHVHNSMALTMCIQGENCYSMIDGKRKDWAQHAVMVTPPGAVHSHHNEGDRRMTCLIVQDGALHYHARTIGFSFA